jgi:3-polyprenyl-4-hydroxybenzoate decarboxylase
MPGPGELQDFLQRARIVLPGAEAPAWGLGRCVFVSTTKRTAGDGAKAVEIAWSLLPADAGVADFIVVVDQGTDLHDWEHVLFLMAANADFARDLHRRGRRVAIDATRKMPGDARGGHGVRRFPPMVAFDAATLAEARRVERAAALPVDESA